MSRWSSAIRSAGHSQRLGGSNAGGGYNFDTRGLRVHEPQQSYRGGLSPWERFMRQRERQKALEHDAAMEAEERARKDREKLERQALQAEGQKAEEAQRLAQKAAEQDQETARREAALRSKVEEYDERRADMKQRHDDAQAERQADFNAREAARHADLDANRRQRALEKARGEAERMAERIQLHEQDQKLKAKKQASAALAKGKGRREAEARDAAGVPAPTTYEPFRVSDQERELASAVRMGTTDAWIQKRAQQLYDEDVPAQRTVLPPKATPFREPIMSRELEEFSPEGLDVLRGKRGLSAEQEWLRNASAADYRAYEAWKSGAGPRPASLPEEPEPIPATPTPAPPTPAPRAATAASGRTAQVARTTRTAGLSSSNSAPAPAEAPTPVQLARQQSPYDVFQQPQRPTPMAPPVAQQAPLMAAQLPPAAAPTGPTPPGAPTPSFSPEEIAALKAQMTAPTARPQMLAVPGPAPAIQTQVEDPTKVFAREAAALAVNLAEKGMSKPEVLKAIDNLHKARVTAMQGQGLTEQAREFEGKWGLFKQAMIGEIPELAAAGHKLADSIDRQGDPGRPLFGFAGPSGPLAAALRGAGAGAIEGASEALSFGDLVPLAKIFSAGAKAARGVKGIGKLAETAPRVARAAELADLIGSAGVAGVGGAEAVQGLAEGDAGKVGRGALMTALGSAGTATSARDIKGINEHLFNKGKAEGYAASDVLERMKAMAGEQVGEEAAKAAALPATGESIQRILPRTKVQQVGEGAFEAIFSNGSKVTFNLDKQEIVLQSKATVQKHGQDSVGKDQQVVGRHVKLDSGSLIEVLKGEGMDTVGHELLHFYRSSGLIADADWARLTMKYQREAAERAARNVVDGRKGAKLWRELSQERRNSLLEEVVADRFGAYARQRVEAGGAAVPDPERGVFARAWDQARDFYRQLRGGEDLPFERMLAGDLGEGSLGSRLGAKAGAARQAYADFARPEDAGARAGVKQYEAERFQADHMTAPPPAPKGSIEGQFAAARAEAPKSMDDMLAEAQRATAPEESAKIRLGEDGLPEREPAGYEAEGLWSPERVNAQLERIGGVTDATSKPDGVHVVDIPNGQAYIYVRNGKVTAAIPLLKNESAELPAPHYIRGAESAGDMAALRARLDADEDAAGRQLFQHQDAALSPQAAEGWNKAYRKADAVGRARMEQHLSKADQDELFQLRESRGFREGRVPSEVERNIGRDSLERIVEQTRANGGHSFNIRDGSTPTKGFMVSLPGFEKQIPVAELGPEGLGRYINENLDELLKPGMYVGTWVDGDKLYADVSQNVATREEAVRLGRERNQLGVYDLENGETIRLDGSEEASIKTRRAIDRGKAPEIPAREYQDVSEREDVTYRHTGKPVKAALEAPVPLTRSQQIADFLEGESNKKYGTITGLNLKDPAQRKAIEKRVMAQARDEIKYALEKSPEAAHWYKQMVETMERDLDDAYGGLTAGEQGLFKAILAVTSNGQDVPTNSKIALKIFDNWKKNGTLLTRNWAEDASWGRPAIGEHLEILSEGLKRYGVDGLLEKLRTRMTPAQVRETFGRVSSELPDTDKGLGDFPVYGSHAFGMKLGGFFQNLDGNHSLLTADRWWSRSWNRWLGMYFDRDQAGNILFQKSSAKGKGTAEVIPRRHEAPRGFQERRLMQEVAAKLGKRFGMDLSDIQAVQWFYEQKLWQDLGAAVEGGVSYADGIREAVREVLGKEARSAREGAAGRGPDAELRGVRGGDEGGAHANGGAGEDEAASIRTGERWSGLPKEGLAEEQAARAAGDFPAEESARKGRIFGRDTYDLWRRATGRALDRIREIRSPQGREVGKVVAEQIEARDEHAVRRASQATATFKRAYNAFARVTKAQGGDVAASWRKVVDALDGKKAENGRLLVGYGDLSGPEKSLYTVTKAIFKQVKKEAIEAGVFTGQNISSYWPHMREGAPMEYDEVIRAHSDWLQSTPEGQKRLAKLRDKDDTWLKGIIGDEATFDELASLDLARNWESDLQLKKHPHLEKLRTGALKDYSTKPEVVGEYLRGAYRRIAEGRYLGDKAQVVRAAIGQMSQSDAAFVRDVFEQNFGSRRPSAWGAGADRIARSANYIQGLSKLMNAALVQPAQAATMAAHLVGRHGIMGGLRAFSDGLVQTLANRQVAQADASRSGATHAADTSESMNAFSGTHSAAERFLTETLKLGKVPGLGRALKTGWFVRDMDKGVRIFADSAGRFAYLEALKQRNVKALTEMLGTKQLAELAIREDLPQLEKLRDITLRGLSGDIVIDGGFFNRTEKTTTPDGKKLTTRRVDAPRASGWGLRDAVDRMDRAGKFLADRTQYRNRPIDAPLVWNTPAMKFFHPFMSFPLQHWYWQKGEIQALRKARAAGDTQAVKQHLGTLVAYNVIFAPLLGGALMSARSHLQGKGTESRQINPYDSTIVKLMDALGPDPIANENWDLKLLGLEALQAWNFAGGVGIPTAMMDRATNAFVSESSRGDTGRAFANALGANVGAIYDTGVLVKDVVSAINNWVEGKSSKKDWSAVRRALWRMTSHVPGLNAPFGLGSAMRSRGIAGEDGRKPTSPGWLGAKEPGASWNFRRGITTPSSEEQRRQNLEDWQDADERARERAEASWEDEAA